MNRKGCLLQAIDTACSDRADKYGQPENNFDLIAKLWSNYTGAEISAQDVACMMIMLKIARVKSGNYKADNYIDIAGYSACACEIEARENANND